MANLIARHLAALATGLFLGWVIINPGAMLQQVVFTTGSITLPIRNGIMCYCVTEGGSKYWRGKSNSNNCASRGDPYNKYRFNSIDFPLNVPSLSCCVSKPKIGTKTHNGYGCK